MKLAEDHTPLVLFIVAAPMFMRQCGVNTYVAKVAQSNIEAILRKFIVNTIRQARQKRILREAGTNCDQLVDR